MANKYKLFSTSISAEKLYKSYFILESSTCPIIARNEDEAVGKAMRLAKEDWLESKGYYNHSAIVCIVPQEMIDLLK